MKLIILNTNIDLATGTEVDQINNITPCFTDVPDGYTDVTSYITLNTFYKYCDIDYILFRDTLKSLYLTDVNLWATLDSGLQKALVSHYIYPTTYTQSDIDAIFQENEQEDNWGRLVVLFCHARGRRWEKSRQMASFKMQTTDSHQLYIDTKQFKNEFIDANDASLIYWLTSSNSNPYNLDFSTTGFASQSYFSQPLLDLLLSILIDGNYTGNW